MRICFKLIIALFLSIMCGISHAEKLETFRLVTDASSLQEGDKVIIVNQAAKAALSTTCNSSSIDGTEISFDGDVVVPTENVQLFTLEVRVLAGISKWVQNIYALLPRKKV